MRADGLGVVLGPLLNDPRVVLAALVDVDSGMVLDACTPDRPGAQYWGADLEVAGAGHAELVRVALALPGRAGPTPAGDELVVSAGPGRHHLVLALPDPHGGRLALSVVVDGSRRFAHRILRRLRAVPAETLTAGPTVVRRPGVGGWVTPVDGIGPTDDRFGPRPDDVGELAEADGRLLSGPAAERGPEPLADRLDHGYRGPVSFPGAVRSAGPVPGPARGAPGAGDPYDDVFADADRRFDRRPRPTARPPHEAPGGRGGWLVGPAAAPGPADRPAPGWGSPPAPAEPFGLRTEIGPQPLSAGLFDASPTHSDSGGFGPVPRPEPVGPGPAASGAPIGLVDPPVAADGPRPLPPGRGHPGPPPARGPRPPAPPSALPPGRPG